MGKMRRALALLGVVGTIGFGLSTQVAPAFATGGGTVTPGAVTVQPNTAGSNASYTIPFQVQTALPAQGTISLTGPSGTYFAACNTGDCGGLYSISVSSGGGSAAINTVTYPDPTSPAENSIVITLDQASSILAGATVTINTLSSTTNPTTPSTSYTIQESTSADPTVASSPAYTITNSAADSINKVSGDGQTTQVSTAYKQPLTVVVVDASNNPVPGVAVTFAPKASNGSDGSFASCPANTGGTPAGDCVVQTNSSGQATSSTLTANATAGNFAVVATVNTPTGTANTQFAESITAAPIPTVTGGTVTPVPTTVNATSNYTVTVKANSAVGQGGSISLLAPGDTATLTGTVFPSPSCSAVPVTPCTNITVTWPGGPTNDAYAATVSAATGPGSNIPSAHNNEIAITVGSALAGGPGVPANTLVTITINGVTNPQTANPAYTMDEFDSADTTLVSSNSYAITPGPATKLTLNSGDGQSATVANRFANRLSATAVDQYGNTEVAGAPVTFVLPGSEPSGTFPGGTTTQNDQTDGSGTAFSSFVLAGHKVGQWKAVAEIPNPTAGGPPISPVNFNLTNTPGSPSTITLGDAANNQTIAVGTPYTAALDATVKDAFGNPVPASNVTFISPGAADATFGDSSCSGTTTPVTTCTVATDSSGIAMATDAVAGTKAETYQITVTDGSASARFSEANKAGAAATIVAVSGGDQDAAISTAYQQPLVAQVQDQYGNPVAGEQVAFTAPPSGASGTFGTCTANPSAAECDRTSGADGKVTSSTFTANATAGTYSVTASDPTSGSVTTAGFNMDNLASAPATVTAVTPYTTSATVAGSFGTFAVTVKDASSAPMPGVNVTFTAPSGLGTFANGTTTTTAQSDGNGVATSTAYTASHTAFAGYKVTATPTGFASPTANFTLTNHPGPATSMIVTPNSNSTPQSATVGQAFANPLSAKLFDQYGNGVGGVTVTFTAPPSAPTGTFAAGCNGSPSAAATCAATTDSTGTAVSTVFTAGHASGAYNVSASATNIATPLSYSLTNLAGPGASLSVQSGANQSSVVASSFTDPVSVVVVDAYGNDVSGATVRFTAPNVAKQAGGLFGTQSAPVQNEYVQSNSSGIAASPTFLANKVAGNWALSAQIVTCQTGGCNVGTAKTAAEQNQADYAHLASVKPINATSGQSRQVGQTFAKPLQVQVVDQYGNPVPGMRVEFVLPSSGASAAFAGQKGTGVEESTNSNGVATSPPLVANLITGSWSAAAETLNGNGNNVQTTLLESNTEGYWLAGADGSVQHFGDAAFHGSAAGLSSSSPFVGMAAQPNGSGYYLVNQRGGVFALGAPYYGSMGGQAISGSVVGIAVAPAGNGYWLVTSTGAVYPFGPGAHSYGDLRSTALGSPIVGMAIAPGGTGYWLAAARGGVFAYGTAKVHGNAVGEASSPLVGIVANPSGQGYWLIGHRGAVYNFGPQGLNEGNGSAAGESVVGAAEG